MEGHLPITSSSWAISDTANKTVTFTTGMLEAATSDNVSPLALRCCESFGALLPLCPETRFKVEQLARRNHTSHVLNFIKAQIGYRKGDSVEILSRSDEGVRFLCLAATLCTLDLYDAANRLDTLLETTAQKDQIRPTIKQLQVILESLKTKMLLSDYTKTVVGCEIVARSMLANCGKEYAINNAEVPSRASLKHLVLSLNELGRVGELNSIEIKLRPQQLPWTWGFIQWCLGVSPSLRTLSGKVLLAQSGSPVTITIMTQAFNPEPRKMRYGAFDGDLEVALQKPARSFKEIVFIEDVGSKRTAWGGLVDAPTWIRYQFSIFHDQFPEVKNSAILRSAIGQALYFIICLLPERLLLCSDLAALRNSYEGYLDRGPIYYFDTTTPKPFLDAATRLKVAERLLENHIELVRKEVDPDRILEPSNLADLIEGACDLCASSKTRASRESQKGASVCKVPPFLEFIGTMGSAILTLTLFGEWPETYPWVLAGLRFDTRTFHHRLVPIDEEHVVHYLDWQQLVTERWQQLMREPYYFLSCPPLALFKHAAKLTGQPDIVDSTLISSKSGQVVFPAFFEAHHFMREGFMQLCAFPGKLRRDGMDFDFLLDAWSDTVNMQGLSNDDSGFNLFEVLSQSGTVPENFSTPETQKQHPGSGMEWKIAVQNEILRGELLLHEANGDPIMAWSLVESLARSRLTPPCPHAPHEPAGAVGNEYDLRTVSLRYMGLAPRTLIDVGRVYAKQLATLAQQNYFPPTVVHVDGCVGCALRFCSDGPCRIVIS